MLIKNPRSALSLDIVPHDFGNIARFFSGINNQNKESRKLLNVAAKRFSYKGRVRIIFYALKNIQAGDELFFDYNGSPFH
jgi:SET domain-containing protein